MISLDEAVQDLYRIAVVEGRTTSTLRLQTLADYCVQELERRGLKDVEKEVAIPGAGREKQWDVAWEYDGKFRLGISLKSILKNIPGTVPNRVDDLIGEAANAQLHSPEIAIGYVMVFDIGQDTVSTKHHAKWSDIIFDRLTSLSGRRPPSWTTGTIEDFVLVKVNFGSSPAIVGTSRPFGDFFDTLVTQVAHRNPNAIR
ncbi:MAG: hypothetical protein OXF11_17400 [Deltaproteobacteria bacterium]|nr:hypothetical protein [Deltaproteobacteria bacterium]